jgi:activating signal cointegrator complex subunit 3
LSDLIENSLLDLEKAGCIILDDNEVGPSPLGLIASKYYLKYTTMEIFKDSLKDSFNFGATSEAPFGDFPLLIQVLSNASEFDELPVRHNEGSTIP